MATVTALTSGRVVLEKDVLGEDRIEHHSAFPNQPSVFKGGKGFGAGSLERKVIKEGTSVDVIRGQKYSDNHPAVKKVPHWFGEAGELHVETAPPPKGKR